MCFPHAPSITIHQSWPHVTFDIKKKKSDLFLDQWGCFYICDTSLKGRSQRWSKCLKKEQIREMLWLLWKGCKHLERWVMVLYNVKISLASLHWVTASALNTFYLGIQVPRGDGGDASNTAPQHPLANIAWSFKSLPPLGFYLSLINDALRCAAFTPLPSLVWMEV